MRMTGTRGEPASAITDVPGIKAGHWTGAHTGVTVVLCPAGTVGSGEVRGGAPATREIALLDPSRSVQHVDAVVVTGGSAFGLASAHGVVEWLAEQGRGFPTRGGPVPIVPAAAIFDLLPVVPRVEVAGEGEVADEPEARADTGLERPGPEEGRLAVIAANAADARSGLETGRVGAGRGATIGKWRGPEHAVAGGLGTASATVDGITVGALAVVNAVGDVIAADGTVLAGSSAPADVAGFPDFPPGDAFFSEQGKLSENGEFEATTLVVIATDARCSKLDCFLLAQSGHHGLARSIHPSHTRHDGDVVIALATGSFDAGDGGHEAGSPEKGHEPNLDRLRVVVTEVVAAAIRNSVGKR
jgi:L-aminopeptidase/D-esterase-like protein